MKFDPKVASNMAVILAKVIWLYAGTAQLLNKIILMNYRDLIKDAYIAQSN